MNHLGTQKIITDRLVLRKFTVKDTNAMFKNWANDPDVTKFLTWPPHKNIKVTTKILLDWASKYPEKNFYNWAIVLKHNGKPIGSISAVKVNDDIKKVEIGYCISKDYWGQGIVSEALNALIVFFFENVGANLIEAKHDVNNPNSGVVMKKCGMKYEGTQKESGQNNIGIVDESIYSISAKEYFNNKELRMKSEE